MSKKTLLRILLIVVAVAAVIFALPRTDRTEFTYEEGQPWRYTLLTAPFDIPIYLDSTTYKHQTDSITQNFSPYIIRQKIDQKKVEEMLSRTTISPIKQPTLRRLLAKVYAAGVMPDDLKARVNKTTDKQVRSISSNDGTTANAIDASEMYSLSEAAKWVIDNYETSDNEPTYDALTPEDVTALTDILSANIVLDKANDEKFLSQELQGVNAGQGKIRQGQRIVDRGEIITPQIYRNLLTFEELQNKSTETDHTHELILFVCQLLYVFLIFGLFYLYLAVYRPKVFNDLRALTFMVSLITLFVVLASLMFNNFTFGIYLTPFAAVPVMVLIFVDSRTALMSLITTILLCVLIATYQYQFIISELVTGFMAVLSLNQLSRRIQLLRTSIVIFISYSIIGVLLIVLGGGELTHIDPKLFIAYGANAVLFSLTYVLIVLIEKIFNFTSTVTLVELSDINNPLLRRLAEEAPGTFQHSMQVSTLAADAAHAIGANTQLIRTGALYHDIGKMISPMFFTENQHGVNPHAGLDPQTSARKIISHVTDGVAMAEKAKLPHIIIDFIKEHHGKGLARYFYNTACNSSPDGTCDPAPFTYPGPDPRSKETAILMMADAVEAASRSLTEYTPESISSLVNNIIDSQIKDGRFKESPVSFHDIEVIKDTFKKRLSTIYHTRVAYPERKKIPK
ncbi:MAG: HDIG domain-containing protein [Prevotella sp.]|nr:HDIG domain-containing protein [Prevotella sp.]MCM1075505.1 HDIG domain-containing protein [Ruminococcus sp.]